MGRDTMDEVERARNVWSNQSPQTLSIPEDIPRQLGRPRRSSLPSLTSSPRDLGSVPWPDTPAVDSQSSMTALKTYRQHDEYLLWYCTAFSILARRAFGRTAMQEDNETLGRIFLVSRTWI
jgi:hypothetical protein